MSSQKQKKNGSGPEKPDGKMTRKKKPLAERIALKVPMFDDSLNRLQPDLQNNVFDAEERLEVRKGAAKALVEIGDPSAVPELINILKYFGPDVRKNAAEALKQIAKTNPEYADQIKAALEKAKTKQQ